MIYLDHNATTDIHPEVKQYLFELLDAHPMNASSTHGYGRKSRAIIELARRSIASLLHFDKEYKSYNVTFTSGGTEANNLIINNFRDHEIFISSIEHPSIWNFYKNLSNITSINVNKDGILDINDLQEKLISSKSSRKLLSVMFANNETGIIQPIKQITEIAHKFGAIIHSDCVQSVGKIDTNIVEHDIDCISISGHKFGGISGAGALISKSSLHISPDIIGGGQERNVRSGTENLYGIAALGKAALVAKLELQERIAHMNRLRTTLESQLIKLCSNKIEIVGCASPRLPNTSLIVNNIKSSETQLIALDLASIAISAGSACSSGKVGQSHILTAMGYSDYAIRSAIRVSLGVTNTSEDIDNFVSKYCAFILNSSKN